MSKVVSLKPAAAIPARRSASDWQHLVEAYQRSGEHRHAFCARHGVSVNTLSWWQWRLRQTGAGAGRSNPTKRAPLFVEVEPPGVTPAPVDTPTDWDVELDLGAGMTLRLRRPSC